MQLKRNTVILTLLALSLGFFIYFHEMNGNIKKRPANNKEKPIFLLAEDHVQSLIINSNNYVITLERNEKSEKPKWLIASPEKALANDAIVAYLTDLLFNSKSSRTLSVNINTIKEFGLEVPQSKISIKLKNQKYYTLILGNYTYDKKYIYAHKKGSINKKNSYVEVLLVSKDFANAVNRQLSDWKQLAPVEK